MTLRQLCLVALLPLALGSAARSEETDERVARDLLTVITMEGLPCGKVVSTTRRADQDYTVECKTGDRYRVRIIDERVRVERI